MDKQQGLKKLDILAKQMHTVATDTNNTLMLFVGDGNTMKRLVQARQGDIFLCALSLLKLGGLHPFEIDAVASMIQKHGPGPLVPQEGEQGEPVRQPSLILGLDGRPAES